MEKRLILDKATRRRQLVDAAIGVFAAKGYRVASITDIITAAAVARGTFYLHFQSKEEAFHAVLDRFHEAFTAMAAREKARRYGNPLALQTRLRESLIEWLGFLLSNRDLTKIVLRQAAAVDPDYDRQYLQIVRDMQDHSAKAIRFLQGIKILRADLDPRFLNSVFHGVTTQVVLQAIADGTDPDLEAVADQWIDLLRMGVVRPGLPTGNRAGRPRAARTKP